MSDLIDRFEAKVSRLGDCHEWLAAKSFGGYGQIGFKNKVLYAHRVAWELYNEKPIPNGKLVMHSCDNPKCVNPEHLSLGTDADNMHDMVRKGRGAKGERHGLSKLTEDDVRAIRATPGTETELGARFGVSPRYISDIQKRRRWKHLN